tara:strand:+ start:3174 stop:4598 length:1425 start_codon:yes stop_codon:yes gene_type:complete
VGVKVKFNVINKSDQNFIKIKPLINDFLPFAKKKIGFNRPPTIHFSSDKENAYNLLGKTAHYDPESEIIVVYVDNRHPKDVLRSLAHELVHHMQNCKGSFRKTTFSGDQYAQKDPHLRKMEKEAYLLGNMCFRDWEDNYKKKYKDNYQMYVTSESLISEASPQEYTIVDGDTLSLISGRFYGDIHKWPLIYKNNKREVGRDPDRIEKGTILTIPPAEEWENMSTAEKDRIYSKSKFYKKFDGSWQPVSGHLGLRGPENIEVLGSEMRVDPSVLVSIGEPWEDAKQEWRIWGGRSEDDPAVKERLAAMWRWCGWDHVTPENANEYSIRTPWSGVALSWCFRSDPDFPKSATHADYMQKARTNRTKRTPGYQLFTPRELDYVYEPNDVLCYVPRKWGSSRYHCDIYVGNNQACGGNLDHRFVKGNIEGKNSTTAGHLYGDPIEYIIRKVNSSLREWKNKEVSRLLMEKFNIGIKEN